VTMWKRAATYTSKRLCSLLSMAMSRYPLWHGHHQVYPLFVGAGRHEQCTAVALAVGVGPFLEGWTVLEGAMHHAPEETIRFVGDRLFESHVAIARYLGKGLPNSLRIPFFCNVGGWQFEGVWECGSVLGQGGWKVEGVLELQGHEPGRFSVRGDPSRGSEGSGEGSKGG
jgi:hypothetical protein